jgi:hypothetical protein
VSGVSWSPLLGHHLGHCDLLLAGFGNTNSVDFEKVSYLDHELGYFGVSSLLDELAPKLLLCTEFGGREGDLRVEVIRKMRVENVFNHLDASAMAAILPADIGLFVDLNSLRVKCSQSGEFVDPKDIRVVRSRGVFSRLYYLSPSCCL